MRDYYKLLGGVVTGGLMRGGGRQGKEGRVRRRKRRKQIGRPEGERKATQGKGRRGEKEMEKKQRLRGEKSLRKGGTRKGMLVGWSNFKTLIDHSQKDGRMNLYTHYLYIY